MQQSWISYFSNLVKAHGGINLAQGIPGFQPPSSLMECLEKRSHDPVHQYAPGLGNQKLRSHIAKAYENTISNNFEFMITLGGTEAIQLLYLYLHHKLKGLKAAAFSPVYESYQHLPRIYADEFKALPIESDNLQDELSAFFQSYNPDVFFVNSPGNPYGKTLNQSQFDHLLELCNKHACYLIIDAVYDNFYFGNKKPYYPLDKMSEQVFYVNSFSKRFSITGWRLGYFYAHKSHFDAISDIHDYTGLSCPSVLQESLADFLDINNAPQAYIKTTRELLKNNFHANTEQLVQNGCEIPVTHGGYFIWAKLPEHITDSIAFSKQLYEDQKTAIIPGSHFGTDYQTYIRINIAHEQEKLNSGIKKLCTQLS